MTKLVKCSQMQVLSGNGSDGGRNCLFWLGGLKTREPGAGGSRRGAGGRGAAHEETDDALPCLHAAQLQGSLHSGSGFRVRVQFLSTGSEGAALLVARRRGYSARAQARSRACRWARLLDPLARGAGVPQVDLSQGHSCCQQRECTVGSWVGATVGRGGGGPGRRSATQASFKPRKIKARLHESAAAANTHSFLCPAADGRSCARERARLCAVEPFAKTHLERGRPDDDPHGAARGARRVRTHAHRSIVRRALPRCLAGADRREHKHRRVLVQVHRGVSD